MSLALPLGFVWGFLLQTRPCVCSCSHRLSEDPTHFLSCELLKPVATVRHNRIVRHLSTLVQRAGGVSYVEPRYLEDKRPDIHAFFPDDRIMLDVSVFHPLAPSYSQFWTAQPLGIVRIRRSLLTLL